MRDKKYQLIIDIFNIRLKGLLANSRFVDVLYPLSISQVRRRRLSRVKDVCRVCLIPRHVRESCAAGIDLKRYVRLHHVLGGYYLD